MSRSLWKGQTLPYQAVTGMAVGKDARPVAEHVPVACEQQPPSLSSSRQRRDGRVGVHVDGRHLGGLVAPVVSGRVLRWMHRESIHR